MPVPVMLPVPVPVLETVRVYLGITLSKVAVHVLAWSIVTMTAALVPVQAPLQPVKEEPVVAVAVRVTGVLATTFSVQSLPQVMPVPVILPAPVPVLETVRVYLGIT